MNKLIYTGDQATLVKAAGTLVTFFENTRDVKSASSSSFSERMIKDHVPDDAHFGVHMIIMGSGEDYGFNKNGDFWTRDGLTHSDGNYGVHTFVKHGHFFREHNNRDPKLRIGSIKAAEYNKDMQRAELVVWGDKRKAEKEYQRAKQGKLLSFSMSARVPDDECSICSNRAKKSSLYCTDLKKHMTQWIPGKAKFAYAINHEPKFFDASAVENPADRIAHSLEYIFNPEEMAKAASENGSEFLFSDLQAKLAGVVLPEDPRLGCSTPGRQAWLEKLATEEEYIWQCMDRPDLVSKDKKFYFVKNAAAYGFSPYDLSDADLAIMRSVDPDVLWRQLVKQSACIPFLGFFSYVNNLPIKQASTDPVFLLAQEWLPFSFRKAAKSEADANIETLFTPAPDEKVIDYQTECALNKIACTCSLAQPMANSRILRICSDTPELDGSGVKVASHSTDQVAKAQAMAHAYAMYKVAFVEAMAGRHGQNCVDEPSLLLITYSHKA